MTKKPRRLAHKLSEARVGRRFDEADRLLREELGNTPSDDLLRTHARLLTALGRTEEAFPLWKQLADGAPGDLESCHHVAAWEVARGMTAREAVEKIANDATDLFKDRATRVLTAPVAEADHDARAIVIAGASYCGSTLLDRILGSLPGCASIGESHWLTKSRDANAVVTPIDFGVEDPPFVPRCTICGPDCEVLSLDFRMDLTADRRDWYQKIAGRVGTKTLFAADKNWSKLIDNDPFLRMDALVLFKSPEQAWSSQRSKLAAEREPAFYEEQLGRYMRNWSRNYEMLLNSCALQGEKTFLFFDAFARDRGKQLAKLCEALGVPYDETVLSRAERRHTIGGNGKTVRTLRAEDYAVSIEPLPEAILTQRERGTIAGNEPMQEIFATMRRQHRTLFGD
jgi:hypothetical protein